MPCNLYVFLLNKKYHHFKLYFFISGLNLAFELNYIECIEHLNRIFEALNIKISKFLTSANDLKIQFCTFSVLSKKLCFFQFTNTHTHTRTHTHTQAHTHTHTSTHIHTDMHRYTRT